MGLFPGRGTEQVTPLWPHTHSWNAQIGIVTSSLAIPTEGKDLNFVYSERQSSLALGWQWEEQADEFPVLTSFSALHCVLDSKLPWPTSVTLQICREISPLSHPADSKHGGCAIVQGMVPLLSLLFWEPRGSCGAPLPFRQSRSCFLELHLPGRAAHQLSCLCWAHPSSLQAGWVLPCLPFPLWLLHKLCLPFPYDESEQDSGKGSNQLELNRTSHSVLSERDWDCTLPPLLSICCRRQECSTETSDSPFPLLWD